MQQITAIEIGPDVLIEPAHTSKPKPIRLLRSHNETIAMQLHSWATQRIIGLERSCAQNIRSDPQVGVNCTLARVE